MLRNTPLRSPGDSDSSGNDGAENSGGDDAEVLDSQTGEDGADDTETDSFDDAGGETSESDGDGAADDESGEDGADAGDDDDEDDGVRSTLLSFVQNAGRGNQQNQAQNKGNGGQAENKPGKLSTGLKASIEKMKAELKADEYEFGDKLSSALDSLISPIAAKLDEQDAREEQMKADSHAQYERTYNTNLDKLIAKNEAAAKHLGLFGRGTANAEARAIIHNMALAVQKANPEMSGDKAITKVVEFMFSGKKSNKSGKPGAGQHSSNTRRQVPQGRPATGKKPEGKPAKKQVPQEDDSDAMDPRLTGGVLQNLRAVTSKIANGS